MSQTSFYQKLSERLNNQVSRDPQQFADQANLGKFVAGTEDFSEFPDEMESTIKSLSDSNSATLSSLGGEIDVAGVESLNELTPAQRIAMTHITGAAGAGSLQEQMANGTSFTTAQSRENVMVIGDISGGDVAGVEDYSEEELRSTVGYSVMFNVAATKQSDFAEAHYPTYVVPANKSGFSMSIRRSVVFRELSFNDDGRPTDFNKHSLQHAETRPEILRNEATNVYPVVTPESKNRFVAESIAANEKIEVGNNSLETRPLKVDQHLNIMGLSRYPGMIGEFDHTDVLDPNIFLKQVLFTVATDNAGTEEVDIFNLKTSNHSQSAFHPVSEGNARVARLVYSTEYELNSLTKGKDGNVASLVANLDLVGSEIRVILKLNVAAEINLNDNNMEIQPGSLRLARIYDGETELFPGTTQYDAIATELETGLKLHGVSFKLARTNQNERERGVLVGSERFNMLFLIAPGSPFTNVRPKGSDSGDADINDIITAVRQSSNDMAHRTLMEHRETVKSIVEGGVDISAVRLPGILYLDQAHFRSVKLDLSEVTNLTEHERAADIRALIIDKIRKMTYEADAVTGYSNGLDILGLPGKPELIMGTTSQVSQYLMVDGDARSAGIDYKHTTVTSRHPTMTVGEDNKKYHRLILTFKPKSEKPIPLQNGVHFWMPEQVVKSTLTRKGATNNEVTVTPRHNHFNLCPIYMEILITGF